MCTNLAYGKFYFEYHRLTTRKEPTRIVLYNGHYLKVVKNMPGYNFRKLGTSYLPADFCSYVELTNLEKIKYL